jgi:hypothetical protein
MTAMYRGWSGVSIVETRAFTALHLLPDVVDVFYLVAGMMYFYFWKFLEARRHPCRPPGHGHLGRLVVTLRGLVSCCAPLRLQGETNSRLHS